MYNDEHENGYVGILGFSCMSFLVLLSMDIGFYFNGYPAGIFTAAGVVWLEGIKVDHKDFVAVWPVIRVVFVAAMSFIAGVVLGAWQIRKMRREAVRAGCAVWEADEDGDVQFKWRVPEQKK